MGLILYNKNGRKEAKLSQISLPRFIRLLPGLLRRIRPSDKSFSREQLSINYIKITTVKTDTEYALTSFSCSAGLFTSPTVTIGHPTECVADDRAPELSVDPGITNPRHILSTYRIHAAYLDIALFSQGREDEATYETV